MKNNRFKGQSIDIGGIKYKIKYGRKKFADKKKKVIIKGEIDYYNRVIYLERNMSPSEEITVIIHEICHGILDMILPAKLSNTLEEEMELIIMPFAGMLTTSLRSAGLLKE